MTPFSMRGSFAPWPHRVFEVLNLARTHHAQVEQERFVVKPFSMRGSFAPPQPPASRQSSGQVPPAAGHLLAPAVRYPSCVSSFRSVLQGLQEFRCCFIRSGPFGLVRLLSPHCQRAVASPLMDFRAKCTPF